MYFPIFTILLLQRMKAPYLILCSENDDLAPYQIICNFAQRLQELGADIKLVKWSGSPHVGLLLNLVLFFLSITRQSCKALNGCAVLLLHSAHQFTLMF